MNMTMRLMLVSILMVFAAPAYSGTAVHVFDCELSGEASEEQIEGQAEKWLAAARTMKGGEEFKVFILFPVAAQTNDTDFKFMIVAPSLASVGAFWDGYTDDSPAANLDDENPGFANCPDSAMWEGVKVE
jgi:hypothetical protein